MKVPNFRLGIKADQFRRVRVGKFHRVHDIPKGLVI